MILLLLLALIVARYIRSTKFLALIFASLFFYVSWLLYGWGDGAEYYAAGGLAGILVLFVCLLLARVSKPTDQLRIHKG